MKANWARKVLEVAHDHGMWIDAVSGNEILRAKPAGFAMGHEPPVVMYRADVFRDNALSAVVETGVLPNIGSPGMIRELAEAGYRGPIALRINPGFGHGHVQACDTGGPSSKHGIWYEDHAAAGSLAKHAGMTVVALHAHVGTGPQIEEFDRNMKHLAEVFEELLASYPEDPRLAAQAVNSDRREDILIWRYKKEKLEELGPFADSLLGFASHFVPAVREGATRIWIIAECPEKTQLVWERLNHVRYCRQNPETCF